MALKLSSGVRFTPRRGRWQVEADVLCVSLAWQATVLVPTLTFRRVALMPAFAPDACGVGSAASVRKSALPCWCRRRFGALLEFALLWSRTALCRAVHTPPRPMAGGGGRAMCELA